MPDSETNWPELLPILNHDTSPVVATWGPGVVVVVARAVPGGHRKVLGPNGSEVSGRVNMVRGWRRSRAPPRRAGERSRRSPFGTEATGTGSRTPASCVSRCTAPNVGVSRETGQGRGGRAESERGRDGQRRPCRQAPGPPGGPWRRRRTPRRRQPRALLLGGEQVAVDRAQAADVGARQVRCGTRRRRSSSKLAARPAMFSSSRWPAAEVGARLSGTRPARSAIPGHRPDRPPSPVAFAGAGRGLVVVDAVDDHPAERHAPRPLTLARRRSPRRSARARAR